MLAAPSSEGVPDTPALWGLLDDRPGHAGQVRGLVAAIGAPHRFIPLSYNLFSHLPNLLLGASRMHLSWRCRQQLCAPWPAMVIACGRRSEPVARWIKQQHPATKIVYIMTPASLAGWDRIVIPAHDNPPADPRILRSAGPLHHVTPARLEEARSMWEQAFAPFPRPRIGLLMGDISAATAGAMVAAAERVAGRSGALLITNSRRTGADVLASLTIPQAHYRYDWHHARGDNPYMGILAHADALIVSGDSMSMCIEACATGKPVFIASMQGLAAKHRLMHEFLFEGGYARPLAQAGAHPPHPAAPLAETQRIGTELRGLLAS